MIIVGAKGLAKEVLEVFQQNRQLDNLVFYDDVSKDIEPLLYDRFTVLKNETQAKNYIMNINSNFTIGIGKPQLRHKMYQKFESIGGKATSAISPSAQIGSYDVTIGSGTVILSNAIFSNSTKIGIGGLVYYNVNVTHDCFLGNFVEISPGVTILGRCTVGDFTHIGANATILPNLNIGKNVLVGAGSVVTKSVPDNAVVAGVPARIIRSQNFLNP